MDNHPNKKTKEIMDFSEAMKHKFNSREYFNSKKTYTSFSSAYKMFSRIYDILAQKYNPQ